METIVDNIKTKEKQYEKGQIMQLVGFRLGEEEFGVNILHVQEINRYIDVTRMPESPDFVEGVVNLRGVVIPIISLRKRFNLQEKEKSANTRIVIVEVEDKVVGFIVDSVSEVLRIPMNAIEPPPAIVAGVDAAYLSGVCKLDDRLVIMLDLDKVLSEKELDQLDETQEDAG